MYFLVCHIIFVYVDENDRLKGTIRILEDKLKTSEEVCHKLSFFTWRNNTASLLCFISIMFFMCKKRRVVLMTVCIWEGVRGSKRLKLLGAENFGSIWDTPGGFLAVFRFKFSFTFTILIPCTKIIFCVEIRFSHWRCLVVLPENQEWTELLSSLFRNKYYKDLFKVSICYLYLVINSIYDLYTFYLWHSFLQGR